MWSHHSSILVAQGPYSREDHSDVAKHAEVEEGALHAFETHSLGKNFPVLLHFLFQISLSNVEVCSNLSDHTITLQIEMMAKNYENKTQVVIKQNYPLKR